FPLQRRQQREQRDVLMDVSEVGRVEPVAILHRTPGARLFLTARTAGRRLGTLYGSGSFTRSRFVIGCCLAGGGLLRGRFLGRLRCVSAAAGFRGGCFRCALSFGLPTRGRSSAWGGRGRFGGGRGGGFAV